ncbi:uncharacterized protein C18orf19 homolog A-like [Sitophilus oryzae]|uniref:Uncharacterized protein C18orf19 homolog A-like n=1 Tax=Sitophilus oryzae TaxID=7048 RepID=A0A6J2Y503_SITOR|nr:uncharacterized protein C18orf19 homolog A-like [Sitophilus oryzae]
MSLVVTRILFKGTFRAQLFTNGIKKPYCALLFPNFKVNFNENAYSSIRYVPKPCLSKLHSTCSPISPKVRQFSSNVDDGKKNDNEDTEDKKKLSLFQRFKQMYKDYWYVLVPVHIVTSVAWFGGFYYLAYSGVDIPALLELMNFSEKIVNSMRNSSMGYVAIAYALYKIVTPLRYAVTLGGTTVTIQYLKKLGYIKPMPTDRLKKMYSDTKEGIKGKKENLMVSVKESVKETKEGIQEKRDSIVSSVQKSSTSIKSMKDKVISHSSTDRSSKP